MLRCEWTPFFLTNIANRLSIDGPMEIIDHNGEGKWSKDQILSRYARFAADAGITPRDLSPAQHTEGERCWIRPVMDKVIEGIKADDPACVRIGIEFIEENGRFPFGMILKSQTARVLRKATLTDQQKQRIRRRVFAMLEAGNCPQEFGEYARLVRAIGFDPRDLPDVDPSKAYAVRYRAYLEASSS